MATQLSHPPDVEDAFLARFLGDLPPGLGASFNRDQLAAIRLAFGMRYRMDHAIDLRRTLRLPWGRFYLVLLAGRDCRGEGGRWQKLGGALALATLFGGAAAAGLVLFDALGTWLPVPAGLF